MLRIDVVTLFSEFFSGPLATGLLGKSLAAGRAQVEFVDPRSWTTDRHRSVDDAPYGGGGGMVMKPEPMVAAIEAAKAKGGGPVLLMSPQGRPLAQTDFLRWAEQSHLVIVAGRYEGFDERIRDFVDEEVSLGDFVLTGGEYAALALIDGVVRVLPGTLGNATSAMQDSFSDGLLEYPQYTRPLSFRGREVPEVLVSGDHAKIDRWRRDRAVAKTQARRPDLLAATPLELEDRRVLWTSQPGPVPLALAWATDALDEVSVGQLAALAQSYGVPKVWLVGPNAEALIAKASPIQTEVPVVKTPRSRRTPTTETHVLHPQSVLLPCQDWTEHGERTAAAWVRVGWGAQDKPNGLAPKVFRDWGSGGRGWCLTVGGPVDVPLICIRVASRGAPMPILAQVGVWLDRVRGEG